MERHIREVVNPDRSDLSSSSTTIHTCSAPSVAGLASPVPTIPYQSSIMPPAVQKPSDQALAQWGQKKQNAAISSVLREGQESIITGEQDSSQVRDDDKLHRLT